MSNALHPGPPGVAWVGGQETLRQAGHRMGALGLGVLLVRGDDGRIEGVLSRAMVVACIAAGGDPAVVTAADVAQHASAAGDDQAAGPPAGPDLGTGHDTGAWLAEAAALDRLPDQAVAAALGSLMPESRFLVYLADVVGLGYQEIAGITGMPGDAVAARLHRGRSRLRARLAACDWRPACHHGRRWPYSAAGEQRG